jgi:hypothetical protein
MAHEFPEPIDPERFCQKCGHWDAEDRPIETGMCECAISPQYDRLTYFDGTCEFWKGIDE